MKWGFHHERLEKERIHKHTVILDSDLRGEKKGSEKDKMLFQ